ncbi:MAG: phosphate ABC transporter substrate-binding protein PstS [Intrasporangiaceae bacterium]|nr:phosphate ABC transporter substrate-binding protein PstS [Intrasporangiaceae bacterium]
MNRSPALLAGVALALALAACTPVNERDLPADGGSEVSGWISGAGSTAQAAAMEAWKASFESIHPQVTVSYDPVGSSGGREQFITGAVEYAGSDAYLDDEEIVAAGERCGAGEVIQLPANISPMAVAYNLSGIPDLRLSPDTLAQIFTQEITRWDDPAIAADNPGVTLPDTAITPVNRADGSGTTKNFTDYLASAAPEIWTYGAVDDWPVRGGTGGQGTSGVVAAINQTSGAIGYADESQIGELPAASVKVGEEYVGPSAEAAARILDASPRVEGRGEFDFAIDIDRKTEASGTYPIVLASYTMACTKYEDPDQAALVKAFLSFMVSEEGQLVAQQNAGSAPISESFRATAMTAIDAIETP